MAQVTIKTGHFTRGMDRSARPFRHLDITIKKYHDRAGVEGFKLYRVEYPWWDYRGLDWNVKDVYRGWRS